LNILLLLVVAVEELSTVQVVALVGIDVQFLESFQVA
jgi:hypothetical protein